MPEHSHYGQGEVPPLPPGWRQEEVREEGPEVRPHIHDLNKLAEAYLTPWDIYQHVQHTQRHDHDHGLGVPIEQYVIDHDLTAVYYDEFVNPELLNDDLFNHGYYGYPATEHEHDCYGYDEHDAGYGYECECDHAAERGTD